MVEVKTNKHLLQTLEEDNQYSIEMKKYQGQRTLRQNALFWEYCQKIARETSQTLNECYCQLLEMADIKSEFIVIDKLEMERSLKESFRGVQFIKKLEIGGKAGFMFKVFLGSSKFNTSEMTELIDKAKYYMSEIGLEGEIWE